MDGRDAFRAFMSEFGAVPVSGRNFIRLLQNGEAVLLFPGGVREAYRRRGEEYQLFWPQKARERTCLLGWFGRVQGLGMQWCSAGHAACQPAKVPAVLGGALSCQAAVVRLPLLARGPCCSIPPCAPLPPLPPGCPTHPRP